MLRALTRPRCHWEIQAGGAGCCRRRGDHSPRRRLPAPLLLAGRGRPVELGPKSLRDLRVAEVVELDMQIEDGKVVAYRAKVQLSFKYLSED